MKNSGAESFYKFEGGKKKYFDLKSKKYVNVPSSESFFLLDAYRENNQILKNSECTVHEFFISEIQSGISSPHFLIISIAKSKPRLSQSSKGP